MSELPGVLRTQKLYVSVGTIIEKLPSLQKQTIGHRVEDGILALLESFVMASLPMQQYYTSCKHSMVRPFHTALK